MHGEMPMKKTLIALFTILFSALIASGADYEIRRTWQMMPGGASSVNTWIVPYDPDASGSEIIEVDAVGGAAADTANVYRITQTMSGVIFTNLLVSVATPGLTTVSMINSNYTSVAFESQLRDYFFVQMTATNRPVISILRRAHYVVNR
jgi:hypothetical protein